jgi:CxxC-x17-CxxC domain-containing protein
MPFKKENSRFSKRSGPPRTGGRSFGNRDRPSFERKSFGGGLELFKARCEKCGNDCEVPFKPTNGKPVYCRDCFKKGGDSAPPRRGYDNRSSDEGGSSGDLDEINRKLDKIMRALKID